MAMYRVTYQSMTATYGPSFIEAKSEQAAKEIFASKAFSRSEMSLMRARLCTSAEIRRALLHSVGDHED